MSKQMYFLNEDSTNCYTEDYFQELMADNDVDEIEVFKAEREIGNDFFWCRSFDTAFEKNSDACGVNNCEDYLPRNGKNGVCQHHTNTFAWADKVTLKRKK